MVLAKMPKTMLQLNHCCICPLTRPFQLYSKLFVFKAVCMQSCLYSKLLNKDILRTAMLIAGMACGVAHLACDPCGVAEEI